MRSGKWAVAAAVLAVMAATSPVSAQVIRTGFDTNTLTRNDDGSTGLVNTGFTMNFFGSVYNSLYVNNNGNVTFDGPLFTFTPFNLVTTATPIIAPFFADVDTRSISSAEVTYGTGSVGAQNAFGVNWLGVGHFAAQPNLNDFQLVVIDRSDTGAGNFDFEFNYGSIVWESGQASGGDANGLGGSSARVGWSNGSTESFELEGSAVNGAFLNGGPNELNGERYLFEVRNGIVANPPTVAPEPVSMLLLATGLVGLGVARRRRTLHERA